MQAEKQLGPDWTLMRAGTPGCPDIADWLAEHVAEGGRVGVDPFLHTVRPLPILSFAFYSHPQPVPSFAMHASHLLSHQLEIRQRSHQKS